MPVLAGRAFFFHFGFPMSAKKSKRAESTPAPAAVSTAASASATPEMPAPPPSWIDSPDPRKRLRGRIILAAAWIYVAALGLLALDQFMDLGIFGPKPPPLT